ncbi:MAG: TolC family outer membrane protein [Hydrogenophaga sp.]|nr:TolC family outer membrane protein [Hydrogenophaga sp.]
MALGSAGAQAQNLVELFEAARGFDASYLSARSQYEADLARAEQSRAGLLPQAGLGAGANWAHVDTAGMGSSRNVNTQNITLSASQPLYRPANRLLFEQGQLSLDVARAQLEAAEQDLVIRTTAAYFDVLAAVDTLAFVQAQKTAVGEQLAAAKRNFEVGTSTITDQREAQARFDLVLAQEIAAENDLRVKRLALDQLVGKTGVAPKPLAAPVALPSVQPADPQTWVTLAETTHPTVLQATRGLEIAELETRRAEAGHKPTLDLVGQYEVARGPSTFMPTAGNVRTNTASVGVQFNLPLFAGYAIQNRVKETLALEEKARTDLEAARRGVAQATRTAYFGVISGLGQVKALEAAEASSQSALEANQLGYQVGVRINIDVLNAQSQLFQTKRDLAQARYNVLLGQLRLKQASGQLKPEDLQAVNALLAR